MMEGLYRTRDDRLVSGLSAALARGIGIDAIVVRLLFVVLTLASGVGIVLYLLGTLVVREEDSPAERFWHVVRDNFFQLRYDALAAWRTVVDWSAEGRARWAEGEPEQRRRTLLAAALVIAGATFFLWSLGLFWWLTWLRLLAIVLVVVGVSLLRALRG